MVFKLLFRTMKEFFYGSTKGLMTHTVKININQICTRQFNHKKYGFSRLKLGYDVIQEIKKALNTFCKGAVLSTNNRGALLDNLILECDGKGGVKFSYYSNQDYNQEIEEVKNKLKHL